MKRSNEPSDEGREAILSIDGLIIAVEGGEGTPIVDNVSLSVRRGETVGLVGESGSGKSLTCLAAAGLLGSGLVTQGSIQIDGEDVTHMGSRRQREVLGTKVAMIFQEPMASLNPVISVGHQLDEAIRHGSSDDRRDRTERAVELLEQVGISEPRHRLKQYAHELSGGMCQRIMIAMALAGEPELLIADEPTTALDVTIQAQILDLLRDLVTRLDMGLLLVTHDLGVVAQTCERVCVMYGGRITESGPTQRILDDPFHPYTEGLMKSVPVVGEDQPRLSSIPGSVPTADAMPTGCRFHPRCTYVIDRCTEAQPPLTGMEQDRYVACWIREELNSDAS
ncbi:MAG: ABC transporter ATP-binding protein [Actinomycetota bacterium]